MAPDQMSVLTNIVFEMLIGLTGWTPLNTPLRVQENIGSVPGSEALDRRAGGRPPVINLPGV